jgi:hypothetical protein
LCSTLNVDRLTAHLLAQCITLSLKKPDGSLLVQ